MIEFEIVVVSSTTEKYRIQAEDETEAEELFEKHHLSSPRVIGPVETTTDDAEIVAIREIT